MDNYRIKFSGFDLNKSAVNSKRYYTFEKRVFNIICIFIKYINKKIEDEINGKY